MWKTNAILGGELASHVFIKDSWFGFDDGLYVAARLLKIISESCLSSDEIFGQFLQNFVHLELRLKFLRSVSFADGSFARVSQSSSDKAR